MKYWALPIFLFMTACQAAETPPQAPQSLADLLKITDTTDTPICNLALTDLRANLTADALEAAKEEAFDYSKVIETYADDPTTQIRVIFRRAALKRRMNVAGDTPAAAQTFYDSFEVEDGTPTTLKSFHDEMHYWMDRIAEQSDYGTADSDDFNLRFCVMNERRADLHAASRKDIIGRIKDGVTLPAPELIENINHETSFDDGFTKAMLAKIFTKDSVASLTPLERAQMRDGEALLPFDPITASAFWEERDAEIEAVIEFIRSHDFASPADKLKQMTNIDQSLRKLWIPGGQEAHFETKEELAAFKEGVSERVVKVDEFNTAELQKMLEGRGWFRDDVDGRGAANDAWLIAQHADRNPDFQEVALKLIEAELDAPGVSKSNYAYLYDRVQMRFMEGDKQDKRVQRFGTQGRCTGPGTWEPFPVETPARIDEIRAEFGLGSMAEYKARFKNICAKDQR